MPPKVPPGQELSASDDSAFKNMMRQYESKQYKKAMKLVTQVLANNPNHAESLAMKGLILSNLPNYNKTEAHDLIKLALTKHLRSLICWHVYGLLHRSDQNYVEAIKCYKQALKIEDSNTAILRDLAMLQTHVRDLGSLTETRQKLLETKASSKVNWQMFAFAHHLQGNHDTALAILDTYEKIMGLPETKYDASEFLLYRILIRFESGDYEGTLKWFEQYKKQIVDMEYIWTTSAECHEKLGNMEKAVECYEKLIELNPEDNECIDALALVVGKDKMTAKYNELREKYPTSQTIQKMQADHSTGDEFRKHVTAFIKHYILKGIPSLGSALKTFYACPEKVSIIGEILLALEKEVKDKETVMGDAGNKMTIVWVWIVLAHHFLRLGEPDKSFEYVQLAIEHTPTLDALYSLKAKILKKQNKLPEAARMADRARKMDLADRYLNTKCAKYFLRCNNFQEAEKMFNIFTYKPVHETWSNILDMQVMWYETELGCCLYRMGDIENALKKFLLIDRHFHDIHEDQFYFHHYISHRHNPRSYLGLLRYMDTAKNHRFYCNAAKHVVRCYLDIHKLGKEAVQARISEEFRTHEQEREKLLSKEQKEKDKEFDVAVNYDDPLKAAASPFLAELLKYRGSELDTQLLAIEVHTASGKTVKALQNVKQALALPGAAASAELKKLAVAFFESATGVENAIVADIVKTEKDAILAQFTC